MLNDVMDEVMGSAKIRRLSACISGELSASPLTSAVGA